MAIWNKSSQKIQKKWNTLLAQSVIKVYVEKKTNVVFLKEYIFLFNNSSIDLTSDVLDRFNRQTKSLKITITPSNWIQLVVMNKLFFKIEDKIKLTDILNAVKVSEKVFLNINEKLNINIKKSYIDDFVSFSNLKANKLSFYTNKKNNLKNVVSGVCIVKKENINLLHAEIIKIPSKNPKSDFSMLLNKYFGKFLSKNNSSNICNTIPTCIPDSARICNSPEFL